MEYFLSCDWGTSAFRLRLVSVPELKVITEVVSEKGIAATYQSWREAQKPDRVIFYLGIILEHIQQLEKKISLHLTQVPVVISGMASSTIGMLELPYQELPFGLDGAGLQTQYLKATPDFPHQGVLVSGVKSAHDVMRGEETQLLGLLTEDPAIGQEQVFIFPGTHSKHIWVNNNSVTGFKTYMTGEIFGLLAQKSILSATVAPAENPEEPALAIAFKQGVTDAVGTNLLHAAFRVRTNNLFGKLNPQQNFSYLSGLVIGTELQDLVNSNGQLYLVAGHALQKYYSLALQALGLTEQMQTFPAQWVDEAVVRGQFKIYQRLTD
ncbi:2-dehydro-3-deoxygalactonokinase [Adhaeribacter rhizoryzae]|uniref:2-dehydro-3-deoxygalactonokinase n=1 Tax=Adhaeribacter rhizoryzae TaxID=2607907 RepID=A0A5M6DMU9_9BACT|nr:2-dehydro-3-deoxygalactonokinase [Adhaeribacter rhizoryzae]KAA5547470.1 2-dehydro-3-deoxygalactonokinase [Adhaeribacter rhizoryzae]